MKENVVKHRYKVYGLNIESEIMLPELEILDNYEEIDIYIQWCYER